MSATVKLTKAHIDALESLPTSWRHPSWVSDTLLELEEQGYARRVDAGKRVRMEITDAGCEALKAEGAK